MLQVSRRTQLSVAAITLLVAGGGLGAAITRVTVPTRVMAPSAPTRIASLSAKPQTWFGEPITTVRGRIAEIYGGRIVLDDGSGRVLVELSHEHDGVAPFAVGQTVTAQGRFEDGTIRAMFLVGPDGQAYAVRNHRGGHGHHLGHGRRYDDAGDHRQPEPAPASTVSASPSASGSPAK